MMGYGFDEEDKKREQIAVDKLRTDLATMSTDEISYIQGRYGGPKNAFLREKKFGSAISGTKFSEVIERLLQEKATDDFIDGVFSE